MFKKCSQIWQKKIRAREPSFGLVPVGMEDVIRLHGRQHPPARGLVNDLR